MSYSPSKQVVSSTRATLMGKRQERNSGRQQTAALDAPVTTARLRRRSEARSALLGGTEVECLLERLARREERRAEPARRLADEAEDEIGRRRALTRPQHPRSEHRGDIGPLFAELSFFRLQ